MKPIKILTGESLQEIIHLVESASGPTKEELQHYSKVYGVGIDQENLQKEQTERPQQAALYEGGIVLTQIGVKNNPKLINTLTKVTKLDQSSLHSIHTVEYKEGVDLCNHYDTHSRQTFVILLNSADEGGEFIFEDKKYHFEKGSVINYNGSKTSHGVSKIIKGHRKTIVLFYGYESFVKSTL